MDNVTLNRGVAFLFDRAKLRTTEVAHFVSIHRTTVSRWRHNGVSNITTNERKRLADFIKLVAKSVKKGLLPLDTTLITGKNHRLSAIKTVLDYQAK